MTAGRIRVDQLLPAAHVRDATGESALHLAAGLERAGFEAGIYALTIDRELAGRVQPMHAFEPPGGSDVTILHYALASPLDSALLDCAGKRVIVYHNLTPPEMLLPTSPEVARLTMVGRDQLVELARSNGVDLAIGVSEYNTEDLRRVGFSRTTTLPLPIDLERYDVESEPVFAEQLAWPGQVFITVGRLAPNKRLEDFLRVAAYYNRHVHSSSYFYIAGGGQGSEGYTTALMDLYYELDLINRVVFLGRVSHRDLVTLYRAADVYLCTSAHEGFCAPLVEAMHFGVPILARHSTAIPETLGNAGVTYSHDDPARIAEALRVLSHDQPLRTRLQHNARRRVAYFSPSVVIPRWISALAELAGVRADAALGAPAESS
ncbi:MAG TPA: glycosyltransferase [Acidobacteriota bacterium]|nr:glycosyltransferase [Acidobacteriota bacterium]